MLTDLRVIATLGMLIASFLIRNEVQIFVISTTLLTLAIGAVFIFQNLGWRKGKLILTEESFSIDGEKPINIKKNGVLTIEASHYGSFLSWYSYYLIELSSKKYDVELKCRKKDKDTLLEELRKYEIQP